MKYIFIINPNSRSGKGGMVWEMIQPELLKRGISYEYYYTKRTRHATSIVEEITSDGEEHNLIVVGGDGTLNEVINGIQELDKVTLGYIPSGSGNDFARGMKISKDPLVALDAILSPSEIKKVDIGLLSKAGQHRKFAISAGIGFDAAICHEVAISKYKLLLNKIKLGKLSYVLVALNRLFHDQRVQAEVFVDEESVRIFKKVYFVAIMNQPYEGGGFKFCPKAKANDGKLDVLVISSLPRFVVLMLLPTAFKGWHVLFPGITTLQGERVSVIVERPLAVHTDGEPSYLRKAITAQVLKEQLRVFIK